MLECDSSKTRGAKLHADINNRRRLCMRGGVNINARREI